ncbi:MULTISPECIES: glycosyltransferase family 4 protein [Streptomyces]|uniref:Glycosyltransferase family 1 protein n=1 Tax=Streptomyces dengpaensis TaxID=2049881 RepID=A0ABM6T0F5_9ACTN|nr:MULTISPECIES: glycosyltransferase family 4 protein [Streptomyces]AVH60475.1 glycosyltransferase family 1 protein [Streptomyces dengpaensis]PIB07606.1 hypothetical protein B1C81_18960 [Streptomyces sp. HG99]
MLPRRVVFLASEYPPHVYGGLGTVIAALSRTLAQRSVAVELFVPQQPGYAAAPPGVRLHEIAVEEATSNEEYWQNFCRQAVVRAKEGLAEDIDLVHCHDWMTAPAGIGFRDVLGVPLVFSVHLPQAPGPYRRMEDLGLVQADAVIVNSQAVADEVGERPVGIAPLAILPNGVDTTAYHPAVRPPSREPYVLFVGRLVPQKGVDVLLRAFGAVLRRIPRARLLVVGDGEQRLYLERMARALGLMPQVVFLGWQTGPELVHLYQQAEVLAVPSVYEPFGLVALEGLACGRPVVASRTGGLADIVTDGTDGWLVDPADHLQLAQRLAWLLLDRRLAEGFGSAAVARAAQFAWEAVTARTQRLYADVIDGRRSDGS